MRWRVAAPLAVKERVVVTAAAYRGLAGTFCGMDQTVQNSGRLGGRTALVTGSTSGIGRAIALGYADAGAYVVVSGRDHARGRGVVELIRARGGRGEFVAAALDGSPQASTDLADRAAAALGEPIDILVNNAGIYPSTTTTTTDGATFDRVFAVNVKAPYFLTAAIAPTMAARGHGVIINLGSWIARLGVPIGSLYSASKGALETLTRAWAAEFGPLGIRVNAISPGVTRTDEDADTHPAEAMMAATPAGRSGTAIEVAHAAVFLASDEAAFIHGATLDIDGGRVNVAFANR
jgi:NAD(P)-dependent dehydrogenase (short-subunit alcohol dehydrogenase family)